jgi:hypothetical protein
MTDLQLGSALRAVGFVIDSCRDGQWELSRAVEEVHRQAASAGLDVTEVWPHMVAHACLIAAHSTRGDTW